MDMYLYGIAIKPVKRGPMYLMESGRILAEGLEGNYYSALRNILRSSRQVTAMSLQQWGNAIEEIGNIDLHWSSRRANLCIRGHDFGPDDVGKELLIGGSAVLEITGETDPCKRMDEVFPGLQAALRPSWRGGVTCRVLHSGGISLGDLVRIE